MTRPPAQPPRAASRVRDDLDLPVEQLSPELLGRLRRRGRRTSRRRPQQALGVSWLIDAGRQMRPFM